ncbi:MAG: carboxymuconolactone decarboxylase family protein [Alphaproteobacteria bacterium]|nr:carboxymuconolactone decarboxylase family protein [Alphaproteobacteria bacterium]MBU0797195.1 carboxymuconolactone decarboxylase family protein [Alphaproteobacteria bacterium]MBU0887134.1 carboxymuconolactone decarboxylase family protein [Alphaproteobacteria bacterium]MBU1814384.1 carboxymuconolactone decarboxylase family protein [Alphaproteobacteria bacterium]MBU2090081.1 carboxymuconolactone decarboxylase family protein [Alphaproteobacteria bacterium]
MSTRISPIEVFPEAVQAMRELETKIRGFGIDPILLELVKIRASQINRCAFCLHLHTKEALQKGEKLERLLVLEGWQESSYYTPKERAALAWTESLTLIADRQAADEDYAELLAHFSAEEAVKLTFAITTINAWNRIALGFRYAHPA